MMNSFEANGIAALLPGIGLVLQFVESELNRMLELVDAPKTDRPQRSPEHRSHMSMAAKSAWQNMTPNQRRARIAKMNRSRLLRKQVAQGKD